MSRDSAPRAARRAAVASGARAPQALAARASLVSLSSLVSLASLASITAITLLAGCGSPTSGKSAVELYDEHCLRCHGADGHGDPRALGLAPNSDLSRSQLIKQRARGPIYLRITQGYGAMPGFSHKLERGDVELLVDYVLELERP